MFIWLVRTTLGKATSAWEGHTAKTASDEMLVERELNGHRFAVPDGQHDIASHQCDVYVAAHEGDSWRKVDLPAADFLFSSCVGVDLFLDPPVVRANLRTWAFGAGSSTSAQYSSHDGVTWEREGVPPGVRSNRGDEK